MIHWKHLETYADRQVIINTYQDEELVERDGYHFHRIEASDGHLIIYGHNKEILIDLPVDKYSSFEQMNDFPNHYAFTNEERRVELYFAK